MFCLETFHSLVGLAGIVVVTIVVVAIICVLVETDKHVIIKLLLVIIALLFVIVLLVKTLEEHLWAVWRYYERYRLLFLFRIIPFYEILSVIRI